MAGAKMGRDLIDRYRDRLHGILSCYDRILVTGTLPQVCYAQGMTALMYRPMNTVVASNPPTHDGRISRIKG